MRIVCLTICEKSDLSYSSKSKSDIRQQDTTGEEGLYLIQLITIKNIYDDTNSSIKILQTITHYINNIIDRVSFV